MTIFVELAIVVAAVDMFTTVMGVDLGMRLAPYSHLLVIVIVIMTALVIAIMIATTEIGTEAAMIDAAPAPLAAPVLVLALPVVPAPLAALALLVDSALYLLLLLTSITFL